MTYDKEKGVSAGSTTTGINLLNIKDEALMYVELRSKCLHPSILKKYGTITVTKHNS